MAKKISEMSAEEQELQRAVWKESQAASRSRRIKTAPTHDEWVYGGLGGDHWMDRFPGAHAELRAFENQFATKVQQELGRQKFSPSEEETLSMVAATSYSIKKDDTPFVQEVRDPHDIICGGTFYPDVLGSHLVENTHKFGLERSSTYAALYRDLLRTLDKKFGRNATSSDPVMSKAARDIKSELAGQI